VKKVSGGTTTVFVYGAQGQLAAEYSSAAGSGVGRNYLTVDHLGSTRMVSNATGAVLERHDYRPFGDEVTCTAGQPRCGVAGYGVDLATRLKFTGKERDVETGLDYFGARYLSSAQGRFTIPDWDSKPQAIPYANLANPQTLNLYSYVLNNPLSKADPNGHDWFYVDKKWQWQKGHVYHDANGNATKDKGYAGLLVATKVTGKNALTPQGAQRYNLTLYDQNKVVATGTGFSGNNNYADTPPIKDGNYQILGRFDPPPTAQNPSSPDNNPPPIYGYQRIDPNLNSYAAAVYEAYGPMRAKLSPLDPGGSTGAYFHGQFGDAFHSEGWTHGCLSYGRDTTMIDYMASHFGHAWTGVSVDTQVEKTQ
jgi:RHS repeat-associated protein